MANGFSATENLLYQSILEKGLDEDKARQVIYESCNNKEKQFVLQNCKSPGPSSVSDGMEESKGSDEVDEMLEQRSIQSGNQSMIERFSITKNYIYKVCSRVVFHHTKFIFHQHELDYKV